MLTDINVTLYIYDCPVLGGEGHWGWQQNNVSAPYWRLYWNCKPGAFVRVGAKEWELEPDAVFLMSPGTLYSTRTVEEVDHFYVHFSADEPLNSAMPGLFRLNDSRLPVMAAEALSAFIHDRDSWQTVIAVKTLVLSSLFRLPSGVVQVRKQYDPRLEKVLLLLDYRNNVSNRELAGLSNMSLNNFLLLFQKEIGFPPQTWLRRKRLARSCQLLHFSEASIDEIAEVTGFCDRYHFSRAFKHEYGIGPALHRQQARLLRDAGIKRS